MRVAVDARRDGRERDRLRPELLRHLEAASVARGEQRRLSVPTVAVARPDRVDDPASRQPEAECRLGVARCAPAEGGARLLQLMGAGRPVDGAVDPATPGQGLVGGVHDGVDTLPCDVALHGLHPHGPHPTGRAAGNA